MIFFSVLSIYFLSEKSRKTVYNALRLYSSNEFCVFCNADVSNLGFSF